MSNEKDPTQNNLIGDCVPCGLHEPQRNAFYDGKMLTARDLIAEQSYMMAMRHLGNMLLEGEGTVCGLKLEQHPNDGCRDTHIVLRRGMAISCCGQEIIVPEDTTIPIRKMIENDTELQQALGEGGADLMVKLCREDRAAEMAPVLISDCCTDGSGQLPGRIVEGYGIQLEALSEGSLIEERQVIKPDLKWTHSINTGDEIPSALSIDEESRILYVASSLGDNAFLRGYDMATQSHRLTLSGFKKIDSIVAPTSSRWLFVTGLTSNDQVAIWLFPRSPTPSHHAKPEREIIIPGLTSPAITQLAVSAVSGTLVALSVTDEGVFFLNAWVDDSLLNGNPKATLKGSTLPSTLELLKSGCRAIDISPNGQTLAISLPQKEAGGLFLVPMHRLTDGSENLNDINEFVAKINDEDGDDLTQAFARTTSLRFSFDSRVLHVAGLLTDKDDQGFFARLSLIDQALVKTGRGAHFSLSNKRHFAPDLHIAPDERWVYISTASLQKQEEGFLHVFATEPAKLPGQEPAFLDPIRTVPLHATLSAGVMSLRGSQIYLPGTEQSDVIQHGRVMLIDITEADIAGLFEESINECRRCEDNCCCVVLGHLRGYVWQANVLPRMTDIGEGHDDDVKIDSLTYRKLVPSNATLMQAILEIAARGVESGPPGPRG